MPTETLIWAAAARAPATTPGRDFPALRALFVGGEPLSAEPPARGSARSGACRWSRSTAPPRPAAWPASARRDACTCGPTGRSSRCTTRRPASCAPDGRGAARGHAAVPRGDAAAALQHRGRGGGQPGRRLRLRLAPADRPGARPGRLRLPGRGRTGHPERAGGPGLRACRSSTRCCSGAAGRRRTLLEIEIEVPDGHRDAACAELTAAVDATFGCPAEVTGVPVGTLVPTEVFTGIHDVVKPRSLFGADEDWSKASAATSEEVRCDASGCRRRRDRRARRGRGVAAGRGGVRRVRAGRRADGDRRRHPGVAERRAPAAPARHGGGAGPRRGAPGRHRGAAAGTTASRWR